MTTVYELGNPWPTLEDAVSTALLVVEEARACYEDELDSVWLYGSRARQDHRPDSDLDILLVKKSQDFDPRDQLKKQLSKSLFYRFSGDMRFMFSLHVAYAEQLANWDTMFFRSVRADAIKIA
ncbi:MAG: nucleotidyltransferase domain-containing protein [bacterium]|nr:nucleotidyltransferase domain-containing protein [bacterium]